MRNTSVIQTQAQSHPENTLLKENAPYLTLSRAAVASLALGIAAWAALAAPVFLVLPLIGLPLGWTAYRTIRLFPTEYSGRILAVLGMVSNASALMAAVALHSFTYVTEVPEGYARISFSDLQPVPEHPELPVSPEALKWNGKKVFIKGYMYPEGQRSEIKRFVMVPDLGTCCFGGQPKLTHMMEVTMTDPLRIKYSTRKRKLAGELTVSTDLKPINGLGGVYFQLKADKLQ